MEDEASLQKRRSYADGFRQLGARAEKLLDDGRRDVERFRQDVANFEGLDDSRKLSVRSVLLEFQGKRDHIRKLNLPNGRSRKTGVPADLRIDIEEFLKNPPGVAQLLASKIEQEHFEPIAKKASLLTIAAFRDNWISSPTNLFSEMRTFLIQRPNPPYGKEVWSDIVIPCLRDKFPDRFNNIADDGWKELQESIRACEILSEIDIRKDPAGKLEQTGRAETHDRLTGEVTNPADPTAYVPAKDILSEHDDDQLARNHKRLAEQILPKHPEIKRWHEYKNRLKVHLPDWLAFARKSKASEGADDDPVEVDRRMKAIRAKKKPK
jgi:hypothetical protein